MDSVAVQYVGGLDEVYVPAAGVTARRGEGGAPGPVVSVPEHVAGHEPYWRPLAVGDDIAWLQTRVIGHDADGNPVMEVLDPGGGLLAQADWQRAGAVGNDGGEDD